MKAAVAVIRVRGLVSAEERLGQLVQAHPKRFEGADAGNRRLHGVAAVAAKPLLERAGQGSGRQGSKAGQVLAPRPGFARREDHGRAGVDDHGALVGEQEQQQLRRHAEGASRPRPVNESIEIHQRPQQQPDAERIGSEAHEEPEPQRQRADPEDHPGRDAQVSSQAPCANRPERDGAREDQLAGPPGPYQPRQEIAEGVEELVGVPQVPAIEVGREQVIPTEVPHQRHLQVVHAEVGAWREIDEEDREGQHQPNQLREVALHLPGGRGVFGEREEPTRAQYTLLGGSPRLLHAIHNRGIRGRRT